MMAILLASNVGKPNQVYYIIQKVMQTIKLKSADGRTIYYFNNPDRQVLHNWDGPAVIHPKETKQKPEYHIFGQQMTKEQWDETKRDFNGIPPSKDSRYEQSM
jgi:hypothetical protein